MITRRRLWPRLLSASYAMPPVIAPSPITATMWRWWSAPASRATAMPVGVGEDGGGVAVLDEVVAALLAARVARQAAGLAQLVEPVAAAGDDLVDVGLVAGVPQDRVRRRVEHPVQRQRQLDGAEVGAEVAAALGDRVDDEVADLARQVVELLVRQPAQVGRLVDPSSNMRSPTLPVIRWRCARRALTGLGMHDAACAAARRSRRSVFQRCRPKPTTIADAERAPARRPVEPVVVAGDDDAEQRGDGYSSHAMRRHRRRSSGQTATAHHAAQPMCMLGIAAYWLEIDAMALESTTTGRRTRRACRRSRTVVATRSAGMHALPMRPRRAAPHRARLVEQSRRHQREQREADDRERGRRPRALRRCGKTSGDGGKHDETPSVTTKWATP